MPGPPATRRQPALHRWVYRGARPGEGWHAHGTTPRTLTLLSGAGLSRLTVHKQRWKEVATGRTCHIGNGEMRRKLWMPTMTAVRKNPVVERFYDRLVSRGKPKKLALIAAMRKLLTIVYAVANQGTPFEAPAETA